MKNTIFCWLMAFSLSASAQKADFSKLISPYDSIPEIVYIEKLVSLAWENYPKNKSFENKRV